MNQLLSIVTFAIFVILIALFAVAFRSTVRTGTEKLPWANRKPFNCDTCLCFWGALFGEVILSFCGWIDFKSMGIGLAVMQVVCCVMAGFGLAKLMLRATDRSVRVDRSVLDESYRSVVERLGEPPILFEDPSRDPVVIGDQDETRDADEYQDRR